MARQKFSTIVRKLKPAAPGRRDHHPVPGVDGCYVRVTDRGTRTFTIQARTPHGKQRWAAVPVAIADMDHLTDNELTAVGKEAREGLARIKRGEAAFPPLPAEPDTLRVVAENYIRRHVRKKALRTGDKIERTLERLVYPGLGKRPINDIRRRDISKLMDRIEDENGPVMADRTLEILGSLFAWYEARDDDFISPVRRGMARTKPHERRRERVLSDDEIGALWKHCTGTYGGLIKLLLSTGQRVGKVQRMRWQDIDKDGVWAIPTEAREKTNAEELPLPEQAIEIVEQQTRIVGNEYVFASPRTDHFINGLSKSKKALDQALGITGWTHHDLRRTARSLMARADVPTLHAELVLGHQQRGIVRTYDQHDYCKEKGKALAKLAREIDRIVNPLPVVRLRGGVG